MVESCNESYGLDLHTEDIAECALHRNRIQLTIKKSVKLGCVALKDVIVATKSECRDAYFPSENCSPGARMGVLRLAGSNSQDEDSEKRIILEGMRWGLVPSFTKAGEKPNFFRMFNARSETVPTKSIFSRLLQSNRCIVCIDGFYEWKDEHKGKQPYYIHFKDRPMLCAGMYLHATAKNHTKSCLPARR